MTKWIAAISIKDLVGDMVILKYHYLVETGIIPIQFPE